MTKNNSDCSGCEDLAKHARKREGPIGQCRICHKQASLILVDGDPMILVR